MFQKIIFSSCLLLFAININAQTVTNEVPAILFKGKITYERKLNLHKQFDEMAKGENGNNAWIESMKKNSPKYKTDIFELEFNTKKTLYKPAKEGISESKGWMTMIPADQNIVYTDLEKNKTIAEKKFFEKTFLVEDTLKKFNWKITEEFRTIAGYSCRRAETVILDSVYVIAFYTDAIIANTGPEQFNGLPGMVLGLVLPRLNLTYFATKVNNYLGEENDLLPPTKGDKKTIVEIENSLKKNGGNWGNFKEKSIWFLNL